jgi:3',5'-cyclic-nucleotide phosphodiesterase
MIRLTVISGPDAGKKASYRARQVTIGRGPNNDFALRDGLVSQNHGEIWLDTDHHVYRDLKSRHGTLLRLGDSTVNLHDRNEAAEVSIPEQVHLIVGETLIHVEARVDERSDVSSGISDLLDGHSHPDQSHPGGAERVVKRATESLDAVTKRLITRDPRLVSIFKLSRSLNTVTELDEILQLIVDTTFEAFPAANFFAISVPTETANPEELMKPMLLRERGKGELSRGETLLSQSLLRQVYESQESVLFVRDATGIQPTESMINARITACMAAPLVGQRKLLGVMQADTRGMGGLFGPDDLDLFTVLASYTAFAIERVNLTRNIYEMFEGVVKLSVRAIDARDPTTSGHSERVADYTLRLAKLANRTATGRFRDVTFSREELTELRYAALLHDFGKIGVRESVLTKGSRLREEHLAVVRERFETARSNAHADAFRLALDRGAQLEWSIEAVRDFASRVARKRVEELNEAEQVLLDNQYGRRLAEPIVQRIRRIGEMTFSDSTGRVRQLLSAGELEDMLIPQGTLNRSEWIDMRSHARRSREFLCQIPWSDDLAQIPNIAGWHHEKLDGSGYPDGIAGDAIPVQVRILTISDIFDAMTAADRPYRKAASVERAMQVLVDEAHSGLLDSDLVSLFGEGVVPQLVREGRLPEG